MHLFLLLVQILSNVPSNLRAPAAPAPSLGTGSLLIAACTPGDRVVVTPGPFIGVADDAGLMRITVPAQRPADDAYLVNDDPVHGTVGVNQTLSAVCP